MWTLFDRRPICHLFAIGAMAFSGTLFDGTLFHGAARNVLAQEDNWGGISDTAIENPLPPFDVDHSGEPLKQAVAIDKRLRQICLVFDDAVAKGSPQKINPKDVGVANAAIWRMDRLIGKLANLGEPAAIDFKSRCFEYRKSIQQAAQACMALPTFPPVGKQLQPYAVQQQKVLEQVTPLIAEGNYDAADQSVTKLLDLLGQLAPWIPLDRTPEPLFAARDAIDLGRETLFGPPRREKLLADAKLTLPDPDELPNALRAAANKLMAAKEAQFFGETLSGPDIVRKAVPKWREYEEAYRQAFAMKKMATMISLGSDTATAAKNQDVNASLQVEEVARAKMPQLMAEALVMLLEKDAQDVEASDVPALHQAYVEALGELDVRSPLKDARVQIEQGFTAMLDKAPAYKAQVAAYREATTWMLGWRRRMTLARIRERDITSHASLRGQVKYVFSDTLATRLFDPPPRTSASMAAQHMRRTVELATPVLVGASAHHGPFGPIVSTSSKPKPTEDAAGETAASTAPYWYSSPQGRVIVEGPGATPDLWQAELKVLESDLLAEEGAKPLTIEAASALTSARQGIFTSVGAAIDSFEFEPVLTYLHRHGSQPGTTTFFGTPYQEFGEIDYLSIVLRIRLTEPDWLAHEYFFADLDADLDADPTPVAASSPASAP